MFDGFTMIHFFHLNQILPDIDGFFFIHIAKTNSIIIFLNRNNCNITKTHSLLH